VATTGTSKLTARQAAHWLAERDPVMARLIAETGELTFPARTDTHFATLVRAVTYQQLAGPAARAIHGRLIEAMGGEATPERLIALSTEELRSAGLSANKVASLRDLSTKVLDGTVILDPRRIARMSDDDVVARLTGVRGIGDWTAEIFLLFQLRRMDVWPTGDLGVRRGYGLAWNVPMPTPKQLDALGEPYRPYRSIVAWYCWRAAEHYAGVQATAVTGGVVGA
jgi:DNA-3-methyladenine glycosylase II